MQESGVAVQRFYVADSASEALEAAKRLSEYTHTHTHTHTRAIPSNYVPLDLRERSSRPSADGFFYFFFIELGYK